MGYFTAQTGEGGRGREGVGGGEGNYTHNFKMHNVIATLFLSRFHSDPGVLESGNLVRTDMDLRHTLDETVAAKMKQSSETIVVYHPT